MNCRPLGKFYPRRTHCSPHNLRPCRSPPRSCRYRARRSSGKAGTRTASRTCHTANTSRTDPSTDPSPGHRRRRGSRNSRGSDRSRGILGIRTYHRPRAHRDMRVWQGTGSTCPCRRRRRTSTGRNCRAMEDTGPQRSRCSQHNRSPACSRPRTRTCPGPAHRRKTREPRTIRCARCNGSHTQGTRRRSQRKFHGCTSCMNPTSRSQHPLDIQRSGTDQDSSFRSTRHRGTHTRRRQRRRRMGRS
mmetsp:Transcript_12116/g.42517  ORF Transcript_12116/g.42517 Transcript_12116/m.42517 type:complete len:245 (+) Transcript_12116:325-1059(+)